MGGKKASGGSVDHDAQVRAFVERTCGAQGLPVKVTDPVVLHKVGVLLGGSRPPAHLDAVGVEAGPAFDSGMDGDVIDKGADDGVLARNGEGGPPRTQYGGVSDIAV